MKEQTKTRPRLMSFFEEPRQNKYSGTRAMLIYFGVLIGGVWAKISWYKDEMKPIDTTIALFYGTIILAVVAPKILPSVFAGKFGGVSVEQLADRETGVTAERKTTETVTVTPEPKP